jgi:hypothetical protein
MSIISPKIHAKSTTKTMRVAARDRAAAHGATAPILRSRLTLDDAQARARVMKALGHSARLQILDLLDQGDLCLCELHPLFKMRQPTLSRHLAVLKQCRHHHRAPGRTPSHPPPGHPLHPPRLRLRHGSGAARTCTPVPGSDKQPHE